MEPDRDEIDAWKRHPVTEWLFKELAERIDPAKKLKTARSWDAACRLQGQHMVLDAIDTILEESPEEKRG